MRALTPIVATACLVVVLSSCDSHEDEVCQDVGDCSHGGANDWIAACQAEAKLLAAESRSSGCGTAFDAYYGCADAKYSCQGATAAFPGCNEALAALDACLAGATTGTACASLSAAQESCSLSVGADGGADQGPPPACTAARDCQARCFLTNVADVCAARVDEIEQVTGCATSCPP